MILERKTKEELQQLISDYYDKRANKEFFDNTIAILNQDFLFKGQIEIQDVVTNITLRAQPTRTVIERNYENFDQYIKYYIKKENFEPERNEIEKYNILFQISIFHEITHLYQTLLGLDKTDGPTFIREVCKKYIEFFYKKSSNFQDLFYQTFHDFYFFEHHANVESVLLLKDLYEDERKCLFLDNLFYYWKDDYKKKGEKIISPFEFTLKQMKAKMDLTSSWKMPFLIAINFGLPITLSEYEKMKRLLNHPCKTKQDYNRVIKKIQRIR